MLEPCVSQVGRAKRDGAEQDDCLDGRFGYLDGIAEQQGRRRSRRRGNRHMALAQA